MAARAGMIAGSVRKTTDKQRGGDDRRKPDPAKFMHHLEYPDLNSGPARAAADSRRPNGPG